VAKWDLSVDGDGVERPSRRTRPWLVAALLAGMALLSMLLATPRSLPPPVPVILSDVPGRSPSPFGEGPAVMGPDAAVSEAVPIAEADLAASQLAMSPIDPQATTKDRERFDEIRWFGGDRSELIALARKLDEALPSKLQYGGIAAGAALELKADVLDVLELDPTRRRAQLAAWWMAHPLTSRAAVGSHAASAEYERRELAVLSEWQALRSEDRDAGELEEALESLQPPVQQQNP
jgi:hypothetical protein